MSCSASETSLGSGGVSVRALRYYEEAGLLAPAAVDSTTGYRSYSAHQLPRLHRIVALKDLGLSIRQLAPLLDELSAEQLRGMLVRKRAELQEQFHRRPGPARPSRESPSTYRKGERDAH